MPNMMQAAVVAAFSEPLKRHQWQSSVAGPGQIFGSDRGLAFAAIGKVFGPSRVVRDFESQT